MQQGVQTDATCNIQQCWELLVNDDASVCTQPYMQKFRSVRVITMQVEKELKEATNKNEKGNFGPIGSLYWRQ